MGSAAGVSFELLELALETTGSTKVELLELLEEVEDEVEGRALEELELAAFSGMGGVHT